MKKFSEFRKNSTPAQAKKVSIAISLISAIIFFVLGIFIFRKLVDIILILLYSLFCLLIFLYLHFIIYNLVFYGERKERIKSANEAKQQVISKYNLTKETYTKITLDYESSFEEIEHLEFLIHLLKEANYTVYAKLTENEEIGLIVKDRSENIIYSDTFNNFSYLEKHFCKLS